MARIPLTFPNSLEGDGFSGDINRFFLKPSPIAEEISGNVVGPKKMPGVNFTSIQEALDQSDPGETIYVMSGEYHESLNLSKPGVVLRGVDTGKGAPVVSAAGKNSTITITASNCTVDGFVVTNLGNQGVEKPEIPVPKLKELESSQILVPKLKELESSQILVPKLKELESSQILVPKLKELESSQISVPKLKELESSQISVPKLKELKRRETTILKLNGLELLSTPMTTQYPIISSPITTVMDFS